MEFKFFLEIVDCYEEWLEERKRLPN